MRTPIIASILVILVLTTGCAKRDDSSRQKTNILCTIYPVWLLASNVVGQTDGVRLELLLPADTSPHHTGLRPNDVKKISEANIIIMNGYDVEFEMQISDAIREENPKAIQIIASEGVEPLYYEGKHETNEHGEEHEGHEHKPGSRDPHTWVSPKQAVILVKNIRDGLIKADSSHAKAYNENADAFVKQLEALVAEFEEASKKFAKHNIVTGHMAFGYLARDFNIKIAAVIEVIPQQEPSASELLRMADEIKASGAAAIFTEPLVRGNISKTLGDATGLPVKTLNPCHIGGMDRSEYIKNMKKNLEELKNALM